MKGTLNAIWLTANGQLHPRVVPNLLHIKQQALVHDFDLILWTNLDELKLDETTSLLANDIRINDHKACTKSAFYCYFLTLFNKGMKGDKAAFALASDILRMSIIELSDEKAYCVYFDPNDITFPTLDKSLTQLDRAMGKNPFGFSFFVHPLDGLMERFHVRNDVLLAKKDKNPRFFCDYFTAYHKHLEATVGEYVKPTTDIQAQALAKRISNQTGQNFFKVYVSDGAIFIGATFGLHQAPFSFINCLSILPYQRHIEGANTWLPEGLNDKDAKDVLADKEEHASSKRLKVDSALMTGLFGLFQATTDKALLIKHRHDNELLQEEYDKQHGLILKK